MRSLTLSVCAAATIVVSGCVHERQVRDSPPGSEPLRFSGGIRIAALDHLPPTHRRIDKTPLVMGAFLDQARWQRFAAASGLDRQRAAVDFQNQVIVFVVHSEQSGSLRFLSWEQAGEQGLLMIDWQQDDFLHIGSTQAVVAAVQRAQLSRFRIGWFDQTAAEGADAATPTSPADTLELYPALRPSGATSPAPEAVTTPPPSWHDERLASMAATASVPPGGRVMSTRPGFVELQVAPNVIVDVYRAHADELADEDRRERADASSTCVTSSDPLTAASQRLRSFSLVECSSPAVSVVHARGEVNDRAVRARFRCRATLSGTLSAVRAAVVDVRRVCESVHGDRSSGCPASLELFHDDSGAPAFVRIARRVRWGASVVSGDRLPALLTSRGRHGELDALGASSSCTYRAHGRLDVSTGRCTFTIELDRSLPETGWRIIAAACT